MHPLKISCIRHAEVKDLEMRFLESHRVEVVGSARFAEVMGDVAKGVYPHAGNILAEIMGHIKRSTTNNSQSVMSSTASSGNAAQTPAAAK